MSEARDRAGRLAVGLLGPLRLTVDGQPALVTTGRLRTLLAVLAMSPGEPVSVDRLADALWAETPPGNARRSVQTYVTRLRGMLGAGSIHTTPAGYALAVDPDEVDALRLVRLLDAAARAPDPATERVRLGEALALWRGTPFEGVGSDWLAQSQTPWLAERYLAGVERRVDLDLAEGRHSELVAELDELTARHPLREPLWVRLLVALDRCGRRAEALARYETVRLRLAGELGADPGPELRQVYADLLAGRRPRPASDAGRADDAGPARDAGPGTPDWLVVPRQLPTAIEAFAGREATLATLDQLLAAGDHLAPQSVVITAIAGPAGVGKTTLAVHWAHRVAGRFPDGQLYVNLRGFDASGQAMDPGDAVRGFLDALGVPPHRLPAGLDTQASLFRSLLAGRRVLVLLDNARDADQVRPLLPGAPGCLVVVTSRHQLPGLVATEDARPVALDLLSADDARLLLARRLGKDRVAAEPEAVAEIVTSCARLPLALAIAAGRATTRPAFPLAAIAAELRAARTGLDAFTTDDPATDARAVFSWSYETLTPAAARLFRLLGLHPGPDTSAPAAASLAGLPLSRAQPLLAELCRAHLLTEHTPGRYSSHDLLRAYAGELVHAYDPEADRRAARHRLLDHYLHTGNVAAVLFDPHRDPITLEPPQPEVGPEALSGHEESLAWFTVEHQVLLAAVDVAAASGFDTHTWQLAWTLVGFFFRRGHWYDQVATQQAALAALHRLGSRAGRAPVHLDLARAYTQLGRFPEAESHFLRSLDLSGEFDDRAGRARTHLNLAWLLGKQNRHTEALRHAGQSLDLHRASGHQSGQAEALNSVGWLQAQVGDYESALDQCQRALALHQRLGHRHGEAGAWDSLGYAHHHLGHQQDAIRCYQRALDLARDLDDRLHEAIARAHLGDAHLAAGDPGAAHDQWRWALAILEELDHPDADQIRANLAASLAGGAGGGRLPSG